MRTPYCPPDVEAILDEFAHEALIEQLSQEKMGSKTRTKNRKHKTKFVLNYEKYGAQTLINHMEDDEYLEAIFDFKHSDFGDR